ncbi:hypothetical protein E4J89_15745 [Arthrobacter sp. CAU 1506]|uniref:DNA primase family protein n=1 Tax=Arthrobacter sp. CAU 1506 TaxID=2560052 RepID=UPI0010AC83B0|nr:phage/plasmid primase, P4 family [Arthrobacter sp. CAU 1506]TJY67335.1 hypothetical protein E4J89_15745 [Arthrobacter sp. CAU 1506]
MGTVEIDESGDSKQPTEETSDFPLASSQTSGEHGPRGRGGVLTSKQENDPSGNGTETAKTFDGVESNLAAIELEWQAEWLRLQAKQHRLQMRIAYELAADAQLQLMHVTGLGWFEYDGARWIVDTGDKAARNAVMATIRRLAADAISDKDLLGDLVKSQTASGARGVLELTASMPGIAVKASELDADPYMLNTPTGTLNLKTFELRPHNPVDRLTKITRGAYDKSAGCDKWETFLERVLPDAEVRAYVQRFSGLSLVGRQLEHILVILTGTGRNGKGVTYESIGYALGDYTHFAPSTLFEQTKANANGASPALFDLRGARFVALSETEKTARIASALLKSLTGGDPVTARKLYGDPITFLASWLILLVTNHLPTLPANDPAVMERVRVVPFDVYIPDHERDRQLTVKLEEEADGILTWAVQGLADYWEHGLNEPDAVKVATNDYAAAQDNVSRFIEAICTETPANGGSTTKELHDAYTEWSIADGIFREHRLGRTDFGRALDKLGFNAVKKSRGMVREGLEVEAAGGVVVITSPTAPDSAPSAPARPTSTSPATSSGAVPVAAPTQDPSMWDGWEAEPTDQTWVG